jgi:Arc/MetJ family transcription regulator
MCMGRTNIEIDDAACATVMKRFNLTTKREAVNFALQLLAAEAMTLDEARSLKGSGWAGDLDVMRESRVS